MVERNKNFNLEVFAIFTLSSERDGVQPQSYP